MQQHRFVAGIEFCLAAGCYARKERPSHKALTCPSSVQAVDDFDNGVQKRLDNVVAVRLDIEMRLNQTKYQLSDLENILWRWHDSIEECCRRGLSSVGILKVARTYSAIDEVERRVRPRLNAAAS